MPNSKICLTIGAWQFAPRLKITILTLIVCSCLVMLGCWQLHRARVKQDLLKNLQQRLALAPTKFSTLHEPTLFNNRFLPVSVEGVLINEHNILLDNQIFAHQPGFRVLTPLQVPGLDKLILIDRGWIAAGSDRQHLPTIAPILGIQHISGQIDTIATGIHFGSQPIATSMQWPILINTMDYQAISTQLQHSIYELVIRVPPESPLAFKVAITNLEINPNKNLGYAGQWFSFAALAMLYYLILSTKRTQQLA